MFGLLVDSGMFIPSLCMGVGDIDIEKRQTVDAVKYKMIPKTKAWTAATVILLPLGGRRKRTPGERMKNKIAE